MAAKATTTSGWQQTRAAIRALSVRAGLQAGDTADMTLLVAALAKTADDIEPRWGRLHSD